MNRIEQLVTAITPKSVEFSAWYLDVVRKAELADYSPMKGMMVIRPYGFEIWELIRDHLDKMLKASGHRNAYFPLFIPESFLKKEAEHVEGFAPEVAWVTQGGQEELDERWAVRPTSESIICAMYGKWIKSWRDLPLLINQWANVVRWEKVTRPFLRTTEFLWQEGHTVHASYEEAEEETLKILNIYQNLCRNYLAIPVVAGKKSDREKFAGALCTYSIEALMPDGKALQAGTSHNLGQNFSRAFQIRFESKEQKLEYAWQTSWGVSTRLIGAVIMTHGDDNGLILPPEVAPLQVVIVPITKSNNRTTVIEKAAEIKGLLEKNAIRVYLDDRDSYTPGYKFNDWEMRGVPLRIELGPRDIEKRGAVVVERINREKEFVAQEQLVSFIQHKLQENQEKLYQRALKFQQENTRTADNYQQLKEIIENQRGFVKTGWCGSGDCEARIKADCAATIRIILEESCTSQSCAVCGRNASSQVLFARSY